MSSRCTWSPVGFFFFIFTILLCAGPAQNPPLNCVQFLWSIENSKKENMQGQDTPLLVSTFLLNSGPEIALVFGWLLFFKCNFLAVEPKVRRLHEISLTPIVTPTCICNLWRHFWWIGDAGIRTYVPKPKHFKSQAFAIYTSMMFL